ncbi:gamma-butyrobetaine hydroxylase [Mycena vulgaris]|nr:gamma-butyrobetaine hydroxylase [Mycena vulgaris]
MSLLSRISRRAGLAQRAIRQWSSIAQDGQRLTIDALGTSFPYLWLRDSCLSSDCIHPSTSQKLHRTSDISRDIRPADGGVNLTDDGLHIKWADGHESLYPREFLQRYSSSTRLAEFHNDLAERPWDAAEISRNANLFVPYASLQERAGLRTAIDQLCTDGLLFVAGVPTAETGDVACELRTLAANFSQIRATFYGEVWDVVNVRNSRNIAYTNLDLGLHMDLLYFKNPPKYQILHCLRNRVDGGASLFVDALHAATALSPAHFDVLASTPVPFHYINDGHHLHHEHPTLEAVGRTVQQINYSPPFQAPLRLDTPSAFYGAVAQFAALLADPARVFQHTLRKGDAVIFDNRRVLHARTAFSDRPGAEAAEGEPNRWLKGCYFEADALLDRGRMLRKGLDMRDNM